MMNITIEDSFSECSRLLCPGCGSTGLHHGKIEVFCRQREDAEQGKHITVEPNGWVDVDGVMKGNPSQRRDGILIHLWCESCPDKSVLAISQHKGETQLSMGVIREAIAY